VAVSPRSPLLGCLIQVLAAFAAFTALDRWTGLPGWAAVVAAVPASMLATWLVMMLLSLLRD
jgi:hypothetical protein